MNEIIKNHLYELRILHYENGFRDVREAYAEVDDASKHAFKSMKHNAGYAVSTYSRNREVFFTLPNGSNVTLGDVVSFYVDEYQERGSKQPDPWDEKSCKAYNKKNAAIVGLLH